MPDKQLVEFIVSQKRIGAHIEKIRSDLKTNDWTDADIDQALSYMENRDKKRAHRAKTFKKALLIVWLIIFVLGGTYITLTLMGRSVPLIPQKEPDRITFPDFTEKKDIPIEEEVPAPVIVDDITQVRAAFEKDFSDMKYIRAERYEQGIIVSASLEGTTTIKNLIYIKEGNEWKYTAEKAPEEVTLISSPQATDIKVKPLPALVNNSETRIEVTITNRGDIPTEEDLLFGIQYGNATTTGTYKRSIAADESVIWTYYPYPAGKKHTDKVGKHTFSISMPGQAPVSIEFDLY